MGWAGFLLVVVFILAMIGFVAALAFPDEAFETPGLRRGLVRLWMRFRLPRGLIRLWVAISLVVLFYRGWFLWSYCEYYSYSGSIRCGGEHSKYYSTLGEFILGTIALITAVGVVLFAALWVVRGFKRDFGAGEAGSAPPAPRQRPPGSE